MTGRLQNVNTTMPTMHYLSTEVTPLHTHTHTHTHNTYQNTRAGRGHTQLKREKKKIGKVKPLGRWECAGVAFVLLSRYATCEGQKRFCFLGKGRSTAPFLHPHWSGGGDFTAFHLKASNPKKKESLFFSSSVQVRLDSYVVLSEPPTRDILGRVVHIWVVPTVFKSTPSPYNMAAPPIMAITTDPKMARIRSLAMSTTNPNDDLKWDNDLIEGVTHVQGKE